MIRFQIGTKQKRMHEYELIIRVDEFLLTKLANHFSLSVSIISHSSFIQDPMKFVGLNDLKSTMLA